ncbi:16S rRNA (guanine(966)-N(2))-methyltransferase RsmD [Acetobacter sp. TBRC 12305]|uniref:16S rRNA (Guanine(966)-N(2))-methyltransferase RsmD n=1 Tax=Acetobacter garciniae TaxID=2817435 RepID=A0A939HH66_9PROT|nr:16S rRNA (guanine(966)-N(2))-methyltransferase RsmD [Acetobacter garciniae]MBO1324328.1 16S rRNA (guanine(966)-N(2))-methyltransferase RsmD [Acetobacter garciniae]MBX0344017.1 16S rRNA (guanine(966)-N(2))-methyltransferase RsmD [Acetobacter garciniae]
MVRIIAGTRKGRVLATPEGPATRPTADRVRQALFDMLAHAPWGGAGLLAGAHVLDAFAGTGALGLEALSRGAEHATFFETARPALAALRANIRACGWEDRCTVIARDVTTPPRIKAEQAPASLVFVDPPYNQTLPACAITALKAAGWIAPDATIVIETGRDEPLPFAQPTPDTPAPPEDPRWLAERQHGAARLSIWRL